MFKINIIQKTEEKKFTIKDREKLTILKAINNKLYLATTNTKNQQFIKTFNPKNRTLTYQIRTLHTYPITHLAFNSTVSVLLSSSDNKYKGKRYLWEIEKKYDIRCQSLKHIIHYQSFNIKDNPTNKMMLITSSLNSVILLCRNNTIV